MRVATRMDFKLGLVMRSIACMATAFAFANVSGASAAPHSAYRPFHAVVPISSPVGLAISPSGELYIANGAPRPDGGGQVLVYKDDRELPARTITTGLMSPSALAFDASGDLYVTDTTLNVVQVYAPDGTWMPRRTMHTDPSRIPNGVGVDASGNVWVCLGQYATPGEIQVFGRGGHLLTTITENLGYPFDVVFAKNGDAWVTDEGKGYFAVFDPSGNYLADVPGEDYYAPTYAAFDEGGRIYVDSARGSTINVYNQNGAWIGSFPPNDGLVNTAGIAIAKTGQVYVANNNFGIYGNGGVNVYTLNGTFIKTLK